MPKSRVTLLKSTMKALFKNTKFRQKFPEFSDLFIQIDNRKKVGCCGRFDPELYNKCVRRVEYNADRIKAFLDTEVLEIWTLDHRTITL